MLRSHEWLNHLQTPDAIWRPYAFDRVTVNGRTDSGELVSFSIVGKCYSEFASGPNLTHIAEVAGHFIGAGFYGLESCRALGWRV